MCSTQTTHAQPKICWQNRDEGKNRAVRTHTNLLWPPFPPLSVCLFFPPSSLPVYISLSLSGFLCVLFCLSVCLSVCLPWFIYLNIHSDPQSNARSKIKKFKKNGPVMMAWVNVDVRRNIVRKTLFTKDFFYIYLFLDE